MECPVCGIKHNKFKKAYQCQRKIECEFGYYIIMTSGMPGGLTEKNLLKFKVPPSIDNYRRLKKLLGRMNEFMKKFDN